MGNYVSNQFFSKSMYLTLVLSVLMLVTGMIDPARSERITELETRIIARQSVALTASRFEVPFDFTFGVPIAEVKINGQVFRFLLDTGAVTLIDTRLNKILRLDDTSGETRIVDSQGVSSTVDRVILPTIEFGSARFENLLAVVADLAPVNTPFACLKLDGLLGYNAMPLIRSWTFDFASKKVILETGQPTISPKAWVSPIIIENGFGPRVRMKFARDIQILAELDTGKNSGFTQSPRLLRHFEKTDRLGSGGLVLSSITTGASGLSASNKPVERAFARVDQFQLGYVPFQSAVIEFASEPPLIGNAVLGKFRFTLDWHTATAHFESIKSGAIDLAPRWRTPGLLYSHTGGQMRVDGLINGLSNDELLLPQVGTLLTRIGPYDVSSGNLEDACPLLNIDNALKKAKYLDLEFVNQGSNKKIKIPYLQPFSN
ncbi:MAG: clan AA aspartic protease [Cohaesibacteraceae bacterium]|nr:clan AA aspartic protease [Cohaesibacteraceae bacterium]